MQEETIITDESGDKKKEKISYEYDAVGNRTFKTDNGKVTSYQYNELNQLIGEASGETVVAYQYDKNGNLVSKKGDDQEVYSYSVDGKLLSFKEISGVNVIEESYTYDAEGNRLSKENKVGDYKEKTYFVTDTSSGYSQVLVELDADKKVRTSYTRGDELISTSMASESVENNKCIRTYIQDGHGDVRYLISEAGTVTDSYRYSAYGELKEQSGHTDNSYRYCSERYDEGTGLYYLRARYMNPSTGTMQYLNKLWDMNHHINQGQWYQKSS